MSLYAPLHALLGPSTPATTKANQLNAPVQLSGAFVAAQPRVSRKRASLNPDVANALRRIWQAGDGGEFLHW